MIDRLEHPLWCDSTECTAVTQQAGHEVACSNRPSAVGGHASRRRLLGDGAAVQLVQTARPGAVMRDTTPLVRIFDTSRGNRFITVPLDGLRDALNTLEGGSGASHEPRPA